MNNRQDATQLAGEIKSGAISPVEAVEAAIGAAEKLNPQLNSIIHPRYERALEESKKVDHSAPFAGVPMVLKDLGAPLAGEPYFEGTKFLKEAGYKAASSSYLTNRFLKAGFVVIGRTNCPEMGTTITTEPLSYGPSRNPWNTNHSTGGSSGGSAAAVASGIVTVGHANDGGGSIRIPASCCSLYGLKPSRGRVSQGPEVSDGWGGATIDHVLTTSVRDSAAILDLISGYEPGDPYVAPPASESFLSFVHPPTKRLRVGFLTHPLLPGMQGHPECEDAVRAVAASLGEMGHDVRETHPVAMEEEEFQSHFVNVVAASVTAEVKMWSQILGREVSADELEPDNAFFYAVGEAIAAPDFINSLAWLGGYRRRVMSFWDDLGFDILVTPTIAKPPAQLGYLSDPVEGGARVIEYLQYTAQFNVTGQPAASLPVSYSSTGLPIGVQVVGGFAREDDVISVSAALEESFEWRSKRPTVSV